MDQNAPTALKSLVDKPVRDSEEFFRVFLRFIVDVQVEVLEVAVSLRVGLASHVEDVRDAGFNQLACFERTLERAHVDTRVDLKEANIADRLLAFDVASAEIDVGESATNDLLLFTVVCVPVTFKSCPRLLLVHGSDAEPRVCIELLELRHRDDVAVTVPQRFLLGILVLRLVLLLHDDAIFGLLFLAFVLRLALAHHLA